MPAVAGSGTADSGTGGGWYPEQQRITLAAAAAQGGYAEPAAPSAQLIDQVQGNPCAGGAKRVADGDGTAVDIDAVLINAEVTH